MVSKKIIIPNPLGLHARPASVLAKEATKCKSEITMIVGEQTLNPKSILSIMIAAISKGTEVEICCSGETEAEDLKTLASLLESGSGE